MDSVSRKPDSPDSEACAAPGQERLVMFEARALPCGPGRGGRGLVPGLLDTLEIELIP